MYSQQILGCVHNVILGVPAQILGYSRWLHYFATFRLFKGKPALSYWICDSDSDSAHFPRVTFHRAMHLIGPSWQPDPKCFWASAWACPLWLQRLLGEARRKSLENTESDFVAPAGRFPKGSREILVMVLGESKMQIYILAWILIRIKYECPEREDFTDLTFVEKLRHLLWFRSEITHPPPLGVNRVQQQ